MMHEYDDGYAPNIRPDEIYHAWRRVDLAYDKERASQIEIPSYPDAIDALRFLHRVVATNASFMPMLLEHALCSSGDQLEILGKWPTATDWLVELARKSLRNVTDPQREIDLNVSPPMTLDQYMVGVEQAARMVARSPDPQQEMWALLGHPWLARNLPPHEDELPLRMLDVLFHTENPEAFTEQKWRRCKFFQPGDPGVDPIATAARSADHPSSGTEEKGILRLQAIAAAGFFSDVMDELASLMLVKYAPNPGRGRRRRTKRWQDPRQPSPEDLVYCREMVNALREMLGYPALYPEAPREVHPVPKTYRRETVERLHEMLERKSVPLSAATPREREVEFRVERKKRRR